MKRYVGSLPLAWVDDEVGDDMKECARKRRAPTLIRAIDASIGLSDRDIEPLLEFAAKVLGR